MSEELENLTQETKKAEGSEPFSKDTLPSKPPSKITCCRITYCTLILIALVVVGLGLYCFISFIIERPTLKRIPTMRYHKYDKYMKFQKEGHYAYPYWVAQIDAALTEHTNSCSTDCNMIKCDFETKKRVGQSCSIDLKKFGPCIKSNDYGYKNNTPCIFFYLDTRYNWMPEYYNNSKDLPEDMPTDLKNFINQLSQERPEMLNSLWVSCEPNWSTTKEELGTIHYYPYRGFPGYYFPKDGKGYQSPMMAIQFENPQPNKPINVFCRVWGKNVKHVVSTFEFRIS